MSAKLLASCSENFQVCLNMVIRKASCFDKKNNVTSLLKGLNLAK